MSVLDILFLGSLFFLAGASFGETIGRKVIHRRDVFFFVVFVAGAVWYSCNVYRK
jgi:hypothetical protein